MYSSILEYDILHEYDIFIIFWMVYLIFATRICAKEIFIVRVYINFNGKRCLRYLCLYTSYRYICITLFLNTLGIFFKRIIIT